MKDKSKVLIVVVITIAIVCITLSIVFSINGNTNNSNKVTSSEIKEIAKLYENDNNVVTVKENKTTYTIYVRSRKNNKLLNKYIIDKESGIEDEIPIEKKGTATIK